MRRVKIPIKSAMTIFPEMSDLGNMPRKKKKKMKMRVRVRARAREASLIFLLP